MKSEQNRKRGSMGLIFALGLLAASMAPAQSVPDARLDFGVFPYLSARALLAVYAPMRDSLQATLRQPVQVSTGLSFKNFHDRCAKGEYDLILTPPHMARLVQLEAGYVPVALFSKVLKGVIAVKRDSPIYDVKDLRDKVIVAPDRIALVTFLGRAYLGEHGLKSDLDYTLSFSTSHASAAYSVVQGEADAVFTERAALENQFPEDLRKQLRVLALMGNLPHVMFLAHSRLGAEAIRSMQAAILHFGSEAEGRAFLRETGFEGIRAVTEADLRAMDPYLPDLRKAMGMSP